MTKYEPPAIREVDVIQGEHTYNALRECASCRGENERLLRAIFGEPDLAEADS